MKECILALLVIIVCGIIFTFSIIGGVSVFQEGLEHEETSGIDYIKIIDSKHGLTAIQVGGYIFLASDKYLYKLPEVKDGNKN
jgi:hypothetical protein